MRTFITEIKNNNATYKSSKQGMPFKISIFADLTSKLNEINYEYQRKSKIIKNMMSLANSLIITFKYKIHQKL